MAAPVYLWECRYCQRQWEASGRHPMCPQGCNCDRTEAPAPGVFSTARRIRRVDTPAEPKPTTTRRRKAKAKAKPKSKVEPETAKTIGPGTCNACGEHFARLDMHICKVAAESA